MMGVFYIALEYSCQEIFFWFDTFDFESNIFNEFIFYMFTFIEYNNK